MLMHLNQLSEKNSINLISSKESNTYMPDQLTSDFKNIPTASIVSEGTSLPHLVP